MKKTTYILIGLVAILGWTIYPYSVRADITSNLICWYKLNEGSGTSTTDDGGTCGNGTLAGTTPPSWTTGKIGAYAIDNTVAWSGSGGYVSTPNTAMNGTHQSWTFAMWINPSDLTGQSGHNIFLGGTGANHWLEILSNGHLSYHDYSNTDYEETGTTLSTGTWYHIVVSCLDNQNSTSQMTMYINGSQVRQDTTNICYNNTSEGYYIGTLGNVPGSYGFKGKIDEVRIYTRVLTSTDVSDLYAYTEGGGGGGTVPLIDHSGDFFQVL